MNLAIPLPASPIEQIIGLPRLTRYFASYTRITDRTPELLSGMDSLERITVRDTATGELVLAAAGPVATLYACGVTPYDATHMGHAATYTAWDLLIRA